MVYLLGSTALDLVGSPWHRLLNDLIPVVVIAIALALIVRQVLRNHVTWTCLLWFGMIVAALVASSATNVVGTPPSWFWQIVLVPFGLGLAATPILAEVRRADQRCIGQRPVRGHLRRCPLRPDALQRGIPFRQRHLNSYALAAEMTRNAQRRRAGPLATGARVVRPATIGQAPLPCLVRDRVVAVGDPLRRSGRAVRPRRSGHHRLVGVDTRRGLSHTDSRVRYPSVTLPHEPLIAPVYPLYSGAVAAIAHIGQSATVPFPSRAAMSPHCDTAIAAIRQ